MGKYVTVSVKIPLELKEKLDKLNVKPSKLLRKAIEQELKKREVERIKEEIEGLKPVLSKISMKDVLKSIREDRESR
jgi:post-segregation antitoxin (ccd killing protein)